MSNQTAIAWSDLTVSVGSDMKIILNEINGYFELNSMNALMGGSGAGKTTLLKCLNDPNQYCLAHKSWIGIAREVRNTITKCFIYQDHEQRIMTGLTVRQAITYASKVKNSNKNVNHSEIVSQVMADLLISDVADNRIEKCSGGQKKRVSIALELSSEKKPNLLLIDEPTTGLDSTAARILIQCLHRLSRSHPICIIASIHQPNQELFHMFDTVYVLAKGGRNVYSGPPLALKQHLNECDIYCNENQIPIEILIKLGFNGLNDKRVKQLCDKTNESLKHLPTTDSMTSMKEIRVSPRGFSIINLFTLFNRFFTRNYINNWIVMAIQILIFPIFLLYATWSFDDRIGVIDGCVFAHNHSSGQDCYDSFKDNSILLQNQTYFYYTQISSMILLAVIINYGYCIDVNIFEVEYQNRWYSMATFFWAKFFSDLIFISKVVISEIIIIGLISEKVKSLDVIIQLVYVFGINAMSNQCMASILGIIFKSNATLVTFIVQSLTATLFNFANFLINLQNKGLFVKVITDFNYEKQLFNSLLILIYGFDRCPKGMVSKVLEDYGLKEYELEYRWLSYSTIITFVFLFTLQFILFWANASRFKWLSISTNSSDKSDQKCKNNLEIQNTYIEFGQKENQLEQDDIFIAWLNLSIAIQLNFFTNKKTKILNEISGHLNNRSLNAIMGPSGAGKTTLLQVMAHKNLNYLSIESQIVLSQNSNSKTVFIEQDIDNHLMNGFTVRQSLLYASRLKNSRVKTTKFDHKSIVRDLMEELLISNTADTRVDSCSGGERKRIAIASELTAVHKPSLLLIDEPTSGLDSNSAEMVIACLKRMSRSYRMCIIASIHQPNQELFHMFDTVYVLAKGGRNVYSGPPLALKQHLNEYDIYCNENQIPIEVLIGISTENKDLSEKLSKSVNQKMIDKLVVLCLHKQMIAFKDLVDVKKCFSLRDTYILLKRELTFTLLYDWKMNISQALIYLIMIAFTGYFFFDSSIGDHDGCFDVQDSFCEVSNEVELRLIENLKYHYYMLIVIPILITAFTCITFLREFKRSRNENYNGWYSAGSFILAKTLADMWRLMVILVVLTTIINKYKTFEMYLVYLVIWLFTILNAQSFSQLSVIVLSDYPKLCLLTAVSLQVLLNTFSNHVMPVKYLHYSLQIFSEFTFTRMIWECLMLWIYPDCGSGRISFARNLFDLNGDEFYPNLFRLVFISVFWQLFAVILYIITSRSFSQTNIAKSKDNLNEVMNMF